MKSFTTMRNLYGSMTNNIETANLTLGDQLINDSIRTVCNIRGGRWWFLERVKTLSTVASQQAYQIPGTLRKVIDVTVTVGTQLYPTTVIYDDTTWNQILAANLGESDVPQFVYQQGTQLLFSPYPASNGNTISIRGRIGNPDLTIADLTTPTVTSIANGATTITINAGGLASMAGQYIRITNTGAANTGDGVWYEIASATATTITLVAPYQGTSISAATTACTIAQMSPIPEPYDMAPVYRAVALYWMQQADPQNIQKANTYWKLYDGGQEAGLSALPGGLIGQMLENHGSTIEGAYVPPLGQASMQGAPYYYPRQDATGF